MNEPGVAREAWGRPHPMQLWSAQSKPREGVSSSEGKNLGLTRDKRDEIMGGHRMGTPGRTRETEV